MRRDHELRRFGEWIVAGRKHAAPLVDELLALPVSGWDAWLVAHPDARTVHLFSGLLHTAEADPERALALTDFVVRHVDSLTTPPEADIMLTDVRGRAWKDRALALRSAGNHAGSSEGQERSEAIYRSEPLLQNTSAHASPTLRCWRSIAGALRN